MTAKCQTAAKTFYVSIEFMPNCPCPVKDMRHRVALQETVRTSDGQGGWTEAWETIATVWVSLKPKKAYEKFQALQMQTPKNYEIGMRYRAGVTTKNRFLYGDRIFDIKEVINTDEKNMFLQILAIEK